MKFWENRLEKFDVSYTKMTRFGEQYLEFDDPWFAYRISRKRRSELNNWSFGEVTPEVAIKGFGGAVLLSAHPQKLLNC